MPGAPSQGCGVMTFTAAAPVIDARRIVAGYGRWPVLDEVSLNLHAGELVGIVGPNGSGKTTLVRALAGVLKLSSGEVMLEGIPLTGLRPAQVARRLAVVPQGAELPEGFTGLEVVLQGRSPHLRLLQAEGPRDRDLACQALADCDAVQLADRRAGQLSGGERQRLLLARALAQEPAVMLLDEPTTYLDIAHQAGILDLVVRRCRSTGLAALAVLHDLTLAAQFCDRLLLLERGQVRMEGTATDVLTAQVLESVYGGRVSVLHHPESGRPVVVPLAGPSAGQLG